MALFQLDQKVSEDTITLLRALDGVHVVRQVELPPMTS